MKVVQAMYSGIRFADPGVPFELRALEALLAETVRQFERHFKRLQLLSDSVEHEIQIVLKTSSGDIKDPLTEHPRPPRALPRRELARFLRVAASRVGIVGEVTVLLADDERLQELNRTFRRKNKPTDVLSFPSAEQGGGGDLAISLDTAAAQAAELGHPLAVEVKVLMLHGLLHLAGYDHEQDEGEMRRKEVRLRRELELPSGLIERVAPLSPPRKRAPASPRRRAPAKKGAR